jgi:ketol-acid reductoisomerase
MVRPLESIAETQPQLQPALLRLSVLQKIRSGQFAREFIREMKTPRTRYVQLLRDAEKHSIEKVGARLRGMMAWRAKT